MMGSVIAWDLARSSDVGAVRVADISSAKLSAIKTRLGDKVSTTRIDATDGAQIERFVRRNDVVVSALPHGAVHPVDVAAVGCGGKLVNIAFEDEQMSLDGEARKKGAVLIPGCGVAPGLSNILVAEGTRNLDEAEGHIYVGGLPQRPESPLWYRLVFSVRGLVREYLSARVIREGRVVQAKPFDQLDRVRFSGQIGTLEAFFTDGLGSAVYTLRRLRELDERTLRYPGHAERIRFLIDAGFFSDVPVRVAGGVVMPVEVSEAVLQKVLTKGDPKDVTVMRVRTSGRSGERRRSTVFELVDYFDESNGVSSMGRTTGFTAAIVARMLGRGEITGTGVIPPESALGEDRVHRLLSELAAKGVVVRKKVTIAGKRRR